MRYLVLLLIAGITSSAEQFTLKDGRVLVGTYDEATQTLALDSPNASMHVDQRDIVKREAAPEIPPTAEARPAAEKPSRLSPGAPRGLTELAIKKKALNDARQRASDLEKEYNSAFEALIKDFFATTADLTPITVHLPDDPSDKQLAEAKKLKSFNKYLAELREWRDQKTHIAGVDDPLFGPGTLMEYAQYKNAPWINDLLSWANKH